MDFQVKYLGGHPEIAKPGDITISINKTSKYLELKAGIFSDKIKVFAREIVDISFEEKHKRSAGGALKGAIIGGVLTGGLGFLAGAALGGKRKDDSTIYLTINYNNREFDIILKAGKRTDDLYAAIISCLA